jgi:acyl-CoA synthetase (AMP-forming)/AMP-acid ligase II
LVEVLLNYTERVPGAPAIADPPNREALVGDGPRLLTWGELGRAVDGAATALLDRGLGRGEVVLLQLPNVWELAVAILAVTRAGGIASPAPMQ